MLIIFLLITSPLIIGGVNSRIEHLAKKYYKTNFSHSSFSLKEKLAIYGLNIIMGVVGYPIYPEVSKETLLLMFPPPKKGIRIFYSDFAKNSRKINNLIENFKPKFNF